MYITFVGLWFRNVAENEAEYSLMKKNKETNKWKNYCDKGYIQAIISTVSAKIKM